MPPPLPVILVTILSIFPYRFQVHILFLTHPFCSDKHRYIQLTILKENKPVVSSFIQVAIFSYENPPQKCLAGNLSCTSGHIDQEIIFTTRYSCLPHSSMPRLSHWNSSPLPLWGNAKPYLSKSTNKTLSRTQRLNVRKECLITNNASKHQKRVSENVAFPWDRTCFSVVEVFHFAIALR